MSEIAFIGYPHMLSCLRALGIKAFPVLNPHEALEALKKIVELKQFAAIFITERLAVENIDAIDELNAKDQTNIVLIPDSHGTSGLIEDCFNSLIKSTTGALIP